MNTGCPSLHYLFHAEKGYPPTFQTDDSKSVTIAEILQSSLSNKGERAGCLLALPDIKRSKSFPTSFAKWLSLTLLPIFKGLDPLLNKLLYHIPNKLTQHKLYLLYYPHGPWFTVGKENNAHFAQGNEAVRKVFLPSLISQLVWFPQQIHPDKTTIQWTKQHYSHLADEMSVWAWKRTPDRGKRADMSFPFGCAGASRLPLHLPTSHLTMIPKPS